MCDKCAEAGNTIKSWLCQCKPMDGLKMPTSQNNIRLLRIASAVLALLLLLCLCFTIAVMNRDRILHDIYGIAYEGFSFSRRSLWLALPASGLLAFFCVVACWNPYGKRTTRILFTVSGICIVLSVLSLLLAHSQHLCWQQEDLPRWMFEQASPGSIQKISLKDLNTICQDQEGTSLVYVGRADCADCQAVYPDLERLAADYSPFDLPMYYYDTLQDREKNRDAMDLVLDQLSIKEVPTVLILEQGRIIRRLAAETIPGQLSEYCKQYLINHYSEFFD